MQKKQISMLVAMMFAGVGIAHAQWATGANFVDRSNPDNPISGSNSSISGQLPGSIGTKSGQYVAVSTAVYTAGNNSQAGSGGIAIGDRANANVNNVGNAADNGGATAIGVGAQALNNSAMAFGTVALASGNSAIAVGRQSAAVGDFSIGMGNVADAHGQRSIALGSSAQAADDQSIAIGSSTGGANDGVSAGATFDSATNTQAKGKRSVALGAGARTNGDDQVAIGSNSVGANNNTAMTFGQKAPVGGSVSFGKLGSERQLKNVAAGADGTDAVNVNQLTNVNNGLSTSISSLSTSVGGQITNINTSLSTATSNITNLQAADKLNVKYTDSTHTAVALDGSGGTTIKNVKAGVAATDAANVGQLNSGISTAISTSNSYTDNSVTSLSTTVQGNITTVQNSLSTSIVNATKDAVKYDSAAHNSVTLGGASASAPVGLHNVAAGTADTDAVNVGQIKPLQSSLSTAAGNITNLQGSVSNINTSLSTTVQNVNSLNTSVTNINSSLSTATTNISNLSTSVTNLDGRVTTNETNIGNLQQADTRNVKYDGASGFDTVTLKGTNGTTISNVADGVADHDAANVGQLKSGISTAISTSNSYTDTQVSNLSTSVGSNINTQISNLSTSVMNQIGAATKNAVQYDGDDHASVTLGGANASAPVGLHNVADGVANNDAVNFGQLSNVQSGLQSSISTTNSNVSNLSTSVSNIGAQVTTNTTNIETLQQADTRNVKYDGAAGFDSVTLAGANGTQVKNVADGTDTHDAVNVGQLTKATSGLQQSDALSVKYDSSAKDSVTLGGVGAAAPVKLSNVADGVANNDAVNVGQLTKTAGGLQTQIDTTNSNVTTLGNQVTQNTTNISNNTTAISGLQQNALQFDPSVGAYNASRDGVATKIVNVADGNVAPGSKDAVNGGQLSGVQSTLEQQITNVSNTTGEKLKNVVTYDTNAHGDRTGSITLDPRDGVGTKITHVRAGTLSAKSQDAVNGSQLYATNQTVAAQGQQITSIDGRVTTNTNNIAGLQQDALQWNSSIGGYDASHGSGSAQQIKNVAAGTDDTDAVNVKQLNDKVAGAVSEGTKNAVQYDTNADGSRANSVTLIGGASGPVVINNVAAGELSAGSTQAVNGGQLYATNQTVASQGDQITKNTTDISNLDQRVTTNTTDITNLQASDALSVKYDSAAKTSVTFGGADTGASPVVLKNVAAGTDDTDAVNVKQLKGVQSSIDQLGALAVQYDDSTKAMITLGGANGTKITNVQAGTLSATSTDAVNGSQLYATNQQVSKNTTDITNLQENVTNIQNGKAGLVQQQDPNGQITVGAGTGGTSVNFSGTQGDRTLTGVAAGVNANDAVNKGQLDSAISNVSGNVTNIQNQTNANSAWISRADAGSIGSTATATGKNSVAVGQGSVADRDNSFSVGAKGSERQVTNVAAGTAPTDAVNVQQLNDNLAASSASSQSYTDQRVGQVYNDLNTVKKDMYGGVASALAVAGLPQPTGAGRSMVSAATSNYHGQQGFAAGYSYVTENNKWVVKASVTGNTRSDFGAVVGAGYQW